MSQSVNDDDDDVFLETVQNLSTYTLQNSQYRKVTIEKDEYKHALLAERAKIVEANVKLEEAEKQIVETNAKLEEAERQIVEANVKLEREVERQIIKTNLKLEEEMKVNKPICSHARIGCVEIYHVKIANLKLKVRMRYTEQNRQTLPQSVAKLKSKAKHFETTTAIFYGGINVISSRTLFDKLFSTKRVVLRNKKELLAKIQNEFAPLVSSSFAVGMLYDGKKKNISFVNDVIIDSLSDANAKYCRSLY